MTGRALSLAVVVGVLLVGGAASASGSGRLPSFLGCEGTKAAIRPHSILFACGDGNFYVDHLRWSRWNGASAAAVGIGHVNDCTPYCAAGHFHSYPGVAIHLHRAETCSRHRLLFTRIEFRFKQRKPPGLKSGHATQAAPFWTGSGCR